jgi:hypothetical protein
MSTKSLCGFIGLICVVLAGAGCSATVNSITVTPLRSTTTSPSVDPNANVVNVVAAVHGGAGTTLQSPVVLRVSRVDGVGGTITRNMTNGRVDNLAVPQGRLRYEVEVPYTVVFTSGTKTARKTIEQDGPVSPSCFFFDAPTPGWTGSGYLGWNGQTSTPICEGLTSIVSREGRNAGPENFSNGLRMGLLAARNEQGQLTTGCFTGPPEGVNLVSSDFVSPDLSALPGWSNATGFDLQAAGGTEPAQMQLLIQDSGGGFWREVNANDTAVFHELGGYAPFGMTKQADTPPIRHILLRIFVPRLQPGFNGESAFFIDRICPRN